ncbi:MAG TPA: glutathione S-transferase [Rhizobiales bacterium]|nr:glutathione S-transferase [Hyphomicrobiales bacterium]
MLLYEDSRAPNPRRVRIFLAEKSIEIESRALDIMSMEHFAEEMTDLNPFARVPFLVLDDGQVISETIAICRYLEELNPEPNLFGKGALEVATIEMWQRRIELELFYTVAHAFRHSNAYMAKLEVPQVPDWADANFARLDGVLDKIDKELENREFIAGDRYTIADITALVAIDFMRIIKRRLTDQHPSLLRWHTQVSARPGSVA